MTTSMRMVVVLCMMMLMMMMPYEVDSLSMSAAETTTTTGGTASKKIVVITHAAGRMGKLLALQIHEDPDLDYDTVRAVCRTKDEAYNVECDLGGIIMEGSVPKPIPCDWLETVVVVQDEDDELVNLKTVFEGASAAVLCDASHNELVWEDDENEFRVNVPAGEEEEQNALSSRLLKEIDAASLSTTLDRVVLRSSMGLATTTTASSDTTTHNNAAVVQAMMGGEVALSGPRLAEAQLKESSSSSNNNNGRSYVILRLGALTDDPGMVPLVFDGTGNDALLFQRDDGATTLHPPVLSRADAARVSKHLLKKPWFGPQFCTLDCAWKSKFGRNSAGTEEAILAAAHQNLAADILTATSTATTID